MDSPLKAHQDHSDPDFIWDEYLEDTNSAAAPPDAFMHVESSLESAFKVGMKLEVPTSDDTYWLASVVMTCGELLSLRYAGYEDDRSADFWFNIKSGEFHPVGWCHANSKKLFPPKGILERHANVDDLLKEVYQRVETIPALLSQDLCAGFMPIDQIKCGMKVEIAGDLNPENVWIATILQNIGGRLLLRYDGLEDCSSYDFWLFYLTDRLYQVGYASSNNMLYSVPAVIKGMHTDEEWDNILKHSLIKAEELPFPAHVLESKIPLEEHEFEEGMKLEAVDPQNCLNICPATVAKVFNKYYFLVVIDSFSMEESNESFICCNSNSQMVFPAKWAEDNGINLTVPKGYMKRDTKFSWDEYLIFCNAVAAPMELFSMCCMNRGLAKGMKLEAVDPFCPNNIYAATIDNIADPILFLHFDAEESSKRSFITGVNSFDIYPVGWCASNGYPLQTPAYRLKKVPAVVANEAKESEKSPGAETKVSPQPEQQNKSWCPKIYFNHRCFSGPLLSKSRLAELPKAIGPGPVHLVMNEVISRVVNIAYKSSRVLQILQVHGKPSPGMHQQVVKAKYKGKSYRATIEVVQRSGQVEDFCKKICTKLECCPYLFGPQLVEETCPSNCHTQTKTKFGYNFVKKHKKPGRPPLSTTSTSCEAVHSSGEAIRKGPGRKKKRKHWTQLLAASENSQKENMNKPEDSSAAEEEIVPKEEPPTCDNSEATPKETSVSSVSVKKKIKHIPSSNIVTRGAKLPNFGLWHHVSSFHSRRGRPRTRPIRPYPPRKVGRPLGSTKKALSVLKDSDDDNSSIYNAVIEEEVKEPLKPCTLKSNPINWSVDEVEKYIQDSDCAPLAPLLKEQEIDGQALMMLNFFNIQQYLNLKPEPAEKFCYLIKSLKIQFFTHFVH